MAIVGTTGSASTDNTSMSNAISPSGWSIAAGDLLLLPTIMGIGGNVTFTPPSGWTDAGTLTSPIAYRQVDNNPTQLFVRIATSADVGMPTYTTTCNYAGWWVQQIIAVRGRVHSSLNAAFPRNAVTAAGAVANTPITYDETGVTANAGDDVLSVIFGTLTGGTTYYPTAAITGFTSLANTRYTATSTTAPAIMSVAYPNHSAGATGTLAANITSSGSTITLAPGGFVMALPSATGSSGSKSQGFFGAELLPLGALVWTIGRRNKLAANPEARKRSRVILPPWRR